MAAQGFVAIVGGKLKQLLGIQASAGAADAGKIIAANDAGKLDASFLPAGIGANQVVAVTSEALSPGDFINLYGNAGVLTMRKADNSNGREAWGFVEQAYASGASGTAKRLNVTNSARAGLTAGGEYWLGAAGGVIAAPLDATDAANVNKVSQYLGRANSETELVTVEYVPVIL